MANAASRVLPDRFSQDIYVVAGKHLSRLLVRVAHRVRALRKSQGWTQRKLARLIGTQQSVISRLENAELSYGDDAESTACSLRTVCRIAAALGVSPETLLSADTDEALQKISHANAGIHVEIVTSADSMSSVSGEGVPASQNYAVTV
jgi:transcriptional regulator with XRE-family HTH domain